GARRAFRAVGSRFCRRTAASMCVADPPPPTLVQAPRSGAPGRGRRRRRRALAACGARRHRSAVVLTDDTATCNLSTCGGRAASLPPSTFTLQTCQGDRHGAQAHLRQLAAAARGERHALVATAARMERLPGKAPADRLLG